MRPMHRSVYPICTQSLPFEPFWHIEPFVECVACDESVCPLSPKETPCTCGSRLRSRTLSSFRCVQTVAAMRQALESAEPSI